MMTWAVAVAAAAAASLTAVHVHVERQGLDYAGPLLAFDHLFDLAAALAVLAIATGLGRHVLNRVGMHFERPLDELLFSVPIGAGVLAVTILLLGAAGGLTRPLLLLVLAGAAVLARRELAQLPRLVADGFAQARRDAGGSELGLLGALALAAATAFLLIFALAPPADWDTLMYHIRVPAQYLEQGRIYLPEDNLRASYVNVIHMLYLPLLAVGSQSGPAVLSACFAALLGIAVFNCGGRFFPGVTGSLSVTLLWGTTTLLIVAITPRTDVTLALFTFLAHYALLVALAAGRDRRPLYLAGAILGLAVGVKYHALPYIVALFPLVLWIAYAPTRQAAATLRPLAIFAVLAAAGAFPWLLKNWLLLRAPIYPVLAEPLLEPWLVPFFGSRTVPASVDPDALRIVWESRRAFNLVDAFTAPQRISIEYEGRYYFTNPALVLLPVWLVFVRNRALTWLAVPALGYLLVLLLPFPETNLRYLAPAIPPLTIVVAHVLVRLAERWLPRPRAHLALALLALLALVPSIRTARTWLEQGGALAHLLGRRSAHAYLATHMLPDVRGYAPVVRAVNERVPPDGRVLLLFEGRGFYFAPEVLQDHSSSTWPLLATLRPPDCLASAGITHVLANVGAARYFIRGGLDPGVLRWDAFEAFVEECLTPVFQGAGHVLFVVKPADS